MRRLFTNCITIRRHRRNRQGSLGKEISMSERLWARPVLWPIPDRTFYTDVTAKLLNGTWRLNHSPQENFWNKEASLEGWEEVVVPTQVIHEEDTEYAYARDVEIPSDWGGQRVLLRFEGANCEARVWCNGRYAGCHYGGFVSWDCDITDFCSPGSSARIVVGIRDRQREVCSFHFGGLIRDVILYTQPTVHLMRIQADTYFDSSYTDSRLVVHTGMVSGKGDEAVIKIYLDDDLLGETAAVDGYDADLEYKIIRPRKWDAEHPNLYTLTAKLFQDGRELETAHKKIGFREIRRVEDQVFVNGMEVKLHGVNRHDTHPLTGRGITHELVEQDVRLFKEANVNFIRTSHYPPRPDFLDLCDEYGIYVEDETSVAFVGQTIQYTMNDPAYTVKYMDTFAQQVERDKSHPCVIMWSLGNESYYGDNMRLMNAYAHQEDPERITIFSYPITMQDDDEKVDVWSVHYADWDTDVACMLDQWKRGYSWPVPHRYPVLHDESTHIPCHDPKDLKRDPGIRNFWGETIRQFWDRIWERKGALGCAIWAGIDDVWYRTDSQGRSAPWGLFDGWRRKKPEWWYVRKSYAYVKVLTDTFTCYGQPRLEVENRFNHTNLSEVRVKWRTEKEAGSFMAPEAGPHERCTLTFPTELRPGQWLEVSFIDSQGYQVNEAHLVHQENPVKVETACGGAPAVTRSNGNVILTGESCEWVLSEETGLIVKGSINGKVAVTGGPYLHMTGLALAPWQLRKMDVEIRTSSVMISLRGSYGPVEVSYRMAFDKKGVMTTDYTIDEMPYSSPHNQAFTVCGHDVGGYEEVGLAFDIPAELDTLFWKRKGVWSIYPEWHINRLEGIAGRFPDKTVHSMTEEPAWDWKEDDKEWPSFGKYDIGGRGTYDFRSMKDSIYEAGLGDGEHCFMAMSDGTDSVRAVSGYARDCIFNDDDASITYTGNWIRVNTRNRSYRGEHIMCRDAGAKAEFRFYGTGCIWYATKDIICGTAKVYVDGVFQDEIDVSTTEGISSLPRGNEAVYDEMVYAVEGLPLKEHKLEIEVTGKIGNGGQSSYVIIDRMVVLREGCAGDVRFIVDNEFNYPDLTWGCYYKEPVLVASGYTRRVTTKLCQAQKE